MTFTTKIFALLLLVFSAVSVNGFVAPSGSKSLMSQQIHTAASTKSTTTALSERQWNFNEGQGPWGMKKNAEVWNGRVAQVNFPSFNSTTNLFAVFLSLTIPFLHNSFFCGGLLSNQFSRWPLFGFFCKS